MGQWDMALRGGFVNTNSKLDNIHHTRSELKTGSVDSLAQG